MYVEQPEQLWACFRCGAQQPEHTEDEATGLHLCKECGEEGVITFQLALDIINDMYRREVFIPKEAVTYEDDTMDYDYEINEFNAQ